MQTRLYRVDVRRIFRLEGPQVHLSSTLLMPVRNLVGIVTRLGAKGGIVHLLSRK